MMTSGYHHISFSVKKIVLILIIALLIVWVVLLSQFPVDEDNVLEGRSIRSHAQLKTNLVTPSQSKYTVPSRVRRLLDKNEVVGDHLESIKSGKITVEEALHGGKKHTDEMDKPPMTIEEVIAFLNDYVRELHEEQIQHKYNKYWEIWGAFHDFTVKKLYPWDREYLQRMPVRRLDDTIFLSIASYRDENCFNTIKGAYEKAKYPEKLYVGLVQQNCVLTKCRSGIFRNGTMKDVPPDQDCHRAFCESDVGHEHCAAGRVRALHMDENESLGPYAARYFASKLWYGEQWYMQIDAHMFFRQDWDALSIEMLKKAPSKKPVISHYPPSEYFDFVKKGPITPGERLCGPIFADSELEAQIIRLEGQGVDRKVLDVPRFAPFIAAGYFAAHSDFLREIPFDPFLPWIFMGEEILLSTRFWTHGYDIFSPSTNVVSHIYVRREKPKYWESVRRTYTFDVEQPLGLLVINRVKHLIGYPEASRDMIWPKSLLTAIEQFSMGSERSLESYLSMVGLDMKQKKVIPTHWCEQGGVPKGFEQFAHLYE